MKKNQTVLYILLIYAVIDCVKSFKVINDTIIQREKALYSQLVNEAKSHLEFLKQIEERNQYATLNKGNYITNDDNNETSIVDVFPLSPNPHKTINLMSSICNYANEKAFYHLLDLNKSNFGKYILYNDTLPGIQWNSKDKDSGDNIEDYILLIKVTSQSISVMKTNGSMLSFLEFTFTVDLIKVDFSTFDEDNTLLLLTSTNEIIILRTDIHLKGSTYDTLTASILIPTRKTFGINIKQDHPVITYTQHKLHGNKYIITAYQNGEIFVLNKDLEMKSAVSINNPLRKLHLFNGIIFAITGKEIVFINLLGGNTILLSCSNYYNIIDVHYAPADNLLFFIDSGNRLIVMTIKLAIAKSNENECSSIYHYQLPSVAKINGNSKLITSKSELFILASDYIGHIDLNQLGSIGLHIDHYAIYKISHSQLKVDNDKNRINNEFELYSSNVMGMFYLLYNSNYILKISKSNDQSKQQPLSHTDFVSFQNIGQGSKSNGRVECNGNTICSILFNTASNNRNTIFYLYAVVILIIAALVIYYQRNTAKEAKKKKEYEEDKKKSNEVTNEKLQEMLEQIKKIEKYQQMNPLEQNKVQGDDNINDDNREYSDDMDEEIEDDDIKGHSN